jgi:hypothetical protein
VELLKESVEGKAETDFKGALKREGNKAACGK